MNRAGPAQRTSPTAESAGVGSKSARVSKLLCAGAFVLGATAGAQVTQAAQVVFPFNCIIVDAITCKFIDA